MVDLSSACRTYALDFWGFGDSDRVSARYHVQGYVDHVALFVDQLGFGSLPLVGHGLGGVVVSSVPFVVDQDLVDLPVLLVSGQQHPFI